MCIRDSFGLEELEELFVPVLRDVEANAAGDLFVDVLHLRISPDTSAVFFRSPACEDLPQVPNAETINPGV